MCVCFCEFYFSSSQWNFDELLLFIAKSFLACFLYLISKFFRYFSSCLAEIYSSICFYVSNDISIIFLDKLSTKIRSKQSNLICLIVCLMTIHFWKLLEILQIVILDEFTLIFFNYIYEFFWIIVIIFIEDGF